MMIALVILCILIGVCLYIAISGAVARWWARTEIHRAAVSGKQLDNFDRQTVGHLGVIVGLCWPLTLPFFVVAWSYFGRICTRAFVCMWKFFPWIWNLSMKRAPKALSKEKAPKASAKATLPKAQIVAKK